MRRITLVCWSHCETMVQVRHAATQGGNPTLEWLTVMPKDGEPHVFFAGQWYRVGACDLIPA
jgi:hypothetical protein